MKFNVIKISTLMIILLLVLAINYMLNKITIIFNSQEIISLFNNIFEKYILQSAYKNHFNIDTQFSTYQIYYSIILTSCVVCIINTLKSFHKTLNKYYLFFIIIFGMNIINCIYAIFYYNIINCNFSFVQFLIANISQTIIFKMSLKQSKFSTEYMHHIPTQLLQLLTTITIILSIIINPNYIIVSWLLAFIINIVVISSILKYSLSQNQGFNSAIFLNTVLLYSMLVFITATLYTRNINYIIQIINVFELIIIYILLIELNSLTCKAKPNYFLNENELYKFNYEKLIIKTSYKIKQNINIIKTLSEKPIIDNSINQSFIKDSVNKIETKIKALTDIIDIQHNRLKLNYSTINLIYAENLIIKIINKNQSENKSIKYTIDIEDLSKVLFTTDINCLSYIIEELITNAYKRSNNFKHNKSDIKISLQYKNSQLLILIKQMGVVLDEKIYNNIKENIAFFKINKQLDFKELGLGLATISSYAFNLNGYLNVEISKNYGTSFIVCIPNEITKQKSPISSFKDYFFNYKYNASTRNNINIENNHIDNYKILIFSQEPNYYSMLNELIKQNNYQVVSANNISTLIDYLINQVIDLLIIDGDDSTTYLLDNLNNQINMKNITSILLTDNDSFEYKITAYEQGVEEVLIKPILGIELLHKINNLLNIKTTQKKLLSEIDHAKLIQTDKIIKFISNDLNSLQTSNTINIKLLDTNIKNNLQQYKFIHKNWHNIDKALNLPKIHPQKILENIKNMPINKLPKIYKNIQKFIAPLQLNKNFISELWDNLQNLNVDEIKSLNSVLKSINNLEIIQNTHNNLIHLMDAINYYAPKNQSESSDDLYKTIRNCILIFKNKTRTNQIIILNSIITETPVYINPANCHQLVFNLILNAIEAHIENKSEDAFIKIYTKSENKYINLIIENNAKDIDPIKLQKIFHKPGLNKNKLNSGIGLFICKIIAEENHGTIEVTSAKEITRFTVKFLKKDAADNINILQR